MGCPLFSFELSTFQLWVTDNVTGLDSDPHVCYRSSLSSFGPLRAFSLTADHAGPPARTLGAGGAPSGARLREVQLANASAATPFRTSRMP